MDYQHLEYPPPRKQKSRFSHKNTRHFLHKLCANQQTSKNRKPTSKLRKTSSLPKTHFQVQLSGKPKQAAKNRIMIQTHYRFTKALQKAQRATREYLVRSHELSVRMTSPRRSSASALSGSALRIGKSLARSKRANVFAARKVHWTLRLSGSANRSAFARYALSAHASRFALRFKRKGRSSRNARFCIIRTLCYLI